MQDSNLKRNTLNQRAYTQLLSLLLAGKLSPGAQLDERFLSAEMGISRTPLRSAIVQLVREGLVEYVPYRGNFVRTWTKRQINDLFEVRIALEMLAVKLAIPKLSNEDIDHIRKILDDIEMALKSGNIENYSLADRRFHRFLSHQTGNQTLIETLDRMSNQIQLIRVVANRDPDLVERTRWERLRILTALESRNADDAAELMRKHIDGVRKAVVDQLEDNPTEQDESAPAA